MASSRYTSGKKLSKADKANIDNGPANLENFGFTLAQGPKQTSPSVAASTPQDARTNDALASCDIIISNDNSDSVSPAAPVPLSPLSPSRQQQHQLTVSAVPSDDAADNTDAGDHLHTNNNDDDRKMPAEEDFPPLPPPPSSPSSSAPNSPSSNRRSKKPRTAKGTSKTITDILSFGVNGSVTNVSTGTKRKKGEPRWPSTKNNSDTTDRCCTCDINSMCQTLSCECRKSSRDCVNCLSRMGKCCNPVTDPKRPQPIITLQNGTRAKSFITFLPATSTKKCQRKLASSPLPDKNKSDASMNDDPPPSPHS